MEEVQREAGTEPRPQFCGIMVIAKSSKGEFSKEGIRRMNYIQIKVAEEVTRFNFRLKNEISVALFRLGS